MPKIPSYRSQAQLRVGQVSPQAPAVHIAPTGTGAAISQLGAVMADVGEKMYRLQAKNELYEANTVATQGQNDIMLNAQQDTDLNEWQARRDKELKDLRTNTLKNMKNPLAKREFELGFDRTVIDTNFKLKIMNNRLTINKAAENFANFRDESTKKYLTAISDQERTDTVNAVGKQYDELVSLGAIKGDRASKDFKEWKNDLTKAQVVYDIEIDPATVQKELNKGSKGKYANLTMQEVVKFKAQAEKKEKKNKKLFDKVVLEGQTENEGSLLISALNGELTSEQIINAEGEGAISLEMAKTSQMIMTSLDSDTDEDNDSTYNRLLKEYLAIPSKDLKKMREFRISLGTAYASGDITKETAVKFANRTINPLVDIEVKEEKKGWLKRVADSFEFYSRLSPDPVFSFVRMVRNFLQKDDEGKITADTIDEETKKIIDDEKRSLYPGYDLEDLEATAEETGLDIAEVYRKLKERDAGK